MTSPPLRLEQIFFDKVLVRARRDHNPQAPGNETVQTTAQFARNAADDRLWRLEVSIRVEPEDVDVPPKYEIEVVAIGIVRIHPDVPEEAATRHVGVTGTSLVYSSTREFLMTITGRGPWGSYMLPTTTFHDVEISEQGPGQRAAAIQKSLRERGPTTLAGLTKATGLEADELRPILEELRRQGVVEATGKGAAARYRLETTADGVAEP